MGDINKDDFSSLCNFRNKLETLGHFQTIYRDINDLKFQFNGQLDKLFDTGFKRLNLS